MNTVFGMVCGGLSAAALLALLLIIFRDLGYKAGVKDGRAAGYDEGRKAAEDWWTAQGREVDQARQKIWREEAEPR